MEFSRFSGHFLALQAMESNQGSIIAGVVILLVLGIAGAIVVQKKRQAAEAAEKEKRRADLLSFAGKEKELVSVARKVLREEEENVLASPQLLEAVLRIFITGGAGADAGPLLGKALKKYPGQTQFSDLEIDLLFAKKAVDQPSLDKIWAAFQKRPERKDWLNKYVNSVYMASSTTVSAMKAVGEFYRVSSDQKALFYLGEAYDKKKIFNEVSLAIFEDLTKKEPQKPRWFYALARCRQNLGNFEGSEEAIQTCLSLDENFPSARELLANLRGEDQAPPEPSPVPIPEASQADQPSTGNGLPPRYIDVSELGRGGMGVVYKAFDDVLKRWVAIKVLLESNAPNQAEMKERFLSESRVMACLDHPVIPKVFDVSVTPPCYIALEFLEGTDLRGYLKANPKISLEELIRIGRDLADGFQHASEREVLHRDIKPENMLMEKTGRIRILDFGLAKLEKLKSNLTQEGLVVGTPWYMAPERLKGEPSTVASEIFAFGVTLYEIFAGKRPFDGEDFSVIFFQDPQPLRKIRPECPMELEVLILDCLNKSPTNRPRTFKEIREELNRMLEKTKT